MQSILDLSPLGDRAFLARFDDDAAAVAWAEAVRGRALPGLLDVVVAYDTVALFVDQDAADLDRLEAELRAIEGEDPTATVAVVHEVPVLYDGEDLDEVARRLGLDVAALIAAHSEAEYTVQAIGFLPGFPYAGDLPEALRDLPRRAPPRTRVPAGSVAIVGRQTAIYPAESPGGWHLLGRTPLRIVDMAAGHFPIRVGDRLAFRTIDAPTFQISNGALLPAPARPGNRPLPGLP